MCPDCSKTYGLKKHGLTRSDLYTESFHGAVQPKKGPCILSQSICLSAACTSTSTLLYKRLAGFSLSVKIIT